MLFSLALAGAASAQAPPSPPPAGPLDRTQQLGEACPPKAGEEAALLEGFDAADRLAETWIHDRPFVYPPEPAEPK